MTTSEHIHYYLTQPLYVGHELNGRTVRLLTRVNNFVVRERAVLVVDGQVQPTAADIPGVPDGANVFMSVDSQPVAPKSVTELKDCLTIIASVEQEMRQATEITDRMLDDLKSAAWKGLLALEALETPAPR